MIKYTKHNLSKLEDVFRELHITVRYEKGNFQSGYCIVTGKNMVIVNKFFDVEARINILLEILEHENIDIANLTEESAQWYGRLKKSLLQPS